MAANQTFTNLIRSIEASELNYRMTKTPFSATISVKSSFVKRHDEDSRCPEIEAVNHSASLDLKYIESELKKVELENLSLKAELRHLEDSTQNEQDKFDEETLKLQKVYDTEKRKSEGLEKQIGELRQEILKINRKKTI